MGHLHVAIETTTHAELYVGALIGHRVFRVDAHQSALGVLSVKRSLRSAQDVNAVEHIKVVVEGSLRHQGDVVVIDAYGGVVDTRTDAAHIHR